MKVKLVFRPDRFGRGGDHSSFNEQNFTAIRLVEVDEEYAREHTDKDLPDTMDFDYLERVAKVNMLGVQTLASAGPPPTRVRIDRRQNHDSSISWTATPGVKYRVYWRDTTDASWTHSKLLGEVNHVEFKMMSKDENVYAIGAEGGIPVNAT